MILHVWWEWTSTKKIVPQGQSNRRFMATKQGSQVIEEINQSRKTISTCGQENSQGSRSINQSGKAKQSIVSVPSQSINQPINQSKTDQHTATNKSGQSIEAIIISTSRASKAGVWSQTPSRVPAIGRETRQTLYRYTRHAIDVPVTTKTTRSACLQGEIHKRKHLRVLVWVNIRTEHRPK